jgi:hypothetical protein
MCRRILHTGQDVPVTIVLANLLEQTFPEESKRRKETSECAVDEASGAKPKTWTLPVFVMSCMIPGESIALNIFEPRYRLMFRRCMEGNRSLGITQALQVSTGLLVSRTIRLSKMQRVKAQLKPCVS